MISSKILPKLASDHHPISLQFEIEDELNPIPFRFCPLWIEHEGFMDTVSQAWSDFVNGSPSYVWEQKMKQTKCALKNWIKLPLLTPMSVRKDRVAELSVLQVELENKEVTSSHTALH